MDRTTKLPVLTRRQRRRQKAASPVLRVWLTATSTLLALLLVLVTVPAAAAAVGFLYLNEQTPPAVDRVVEGVVVQAVSFYAANFYEGELPSPDQVATFTDRDFKTTRIYDRTGTVLLWEVIDPRGGNRQVVPLTSISPHLIEATIALEDKTYYDNPGVNLRGIARALYLNVRSGEIQGGGSSITQQLIKLVAIAPEERFEQSYDRKVKEIILAIELSNLYDKDTIMQWYLNTINYGRRAYGAQAAAAEYFGKNVSELTIAEAAMLAMLPNAPALYDPYTQPEEAVNRQRLTLRRMLEEGFITPDEYQAALDEPVLDALVPPGIQASDFKAPHFTLYVVDQLMEEYGADFLYRGGLTVITTLDYNLLQQTEAIAREHIAAMQAQEVDATNAAAVTINPRTGEILSMMGSLDYYNADIDGEINMAMAPRQPGSSVKPYTYLTAFENGYSPASMIWDVRTVFDDYPNPPYVPENYERDYRGPVLLRDALAMSLNIPAVKLMALLGKDKVIETAHRLGINSLRKEEVGLALTLGGGDVTLLDHTYAFGVLANSGVMVGAPVPEAQRRPGYRELNPVSILRIEDAKGEVLFAYTAPETRQVISPQHAYLMQNVMSDNPARIPTFGEENKLVLPDRPVAAKTGTTNDFRDGWTLGFTPQYVTGIWVGNADYHDMGQDAPGGSVAAPIWQRVMMKLHEGQPVEPFPVPPGIVQVQVCKQSGLLPTANCPEVKTEVFIEGTQPTTPDTLFQTFRICGASGQLATVYCPANQVQTRVYMMVPPEAEDWARDNEIPLPPTSYDATRGPVVGGPVSITSPAPYGYVRGTVSIEGSAFVAPTTVQESVTIEIPGVVTSDTISGTMPSPTYQTQTIQRNVYNFRLYRIEIGQGLDPASWTRIGGDHTDMRQNKTLEFWDTTGFANGLYTLQLTLIEYDGGVQRSAVQVYVDNTTPTVALTYPYADQTYELGGDSWLNFQADASDNIAMDKVEFYVNGALFDSSSSTFNVRWALEDAALAPGEEREIEVYAVALDAAGNRTESERVRFRVKERE